MKNTLRSAIALSLGIMLVSCGTSAKMISRMSQSQRVDVFSEVTSEGAVSTGSSDVLIKASLKTPLEGYYPLESRKSAHGKPYYAFLVNIDGQAIQWKAEGQRHDLPVYIDGKSSRDPEAGEGMKYVLEKRIRTAPGAHRVFFGVPGESYYITADILVISGGSYVLEFKPVYRYKTVPTRIPTFFKGVDKFDVEVKELTSRDRS